MVTRSIRELTDENIKEWREKHLKSYDIQEITSVFDKYRQGEFEEIPGFCSVKTLQEIAEQDFILTPGRYVGVADVSDNEEPYEIKMDRLTAELNNLFSLSHNIENEIKKQLYNIGYKLDK